MSGYILCQTKKAEHPYFVESISTNIYTIEELCYYLYHNLYLVDQTIINEDLCKWLAAGAGTYPAGIKAAPGNGEGCAVAEEILYPVFKEINYLTYEELKALNGRLTELNKESTAIRKKRKGDALVENGMYVNAIRVYQKLLDQTDFSKERDGLEVRIMYNLGCAYSYLFQMEKAMECFWNAYSRSGTENEKALKAYLLAYRSIRSKEEYAHRLKELKISEELRSEIREALNHFSKIPEKQAETDSLDVMLEKLARDYHRSTGS